MMITAKEYIHTPTIGDYDQCVSIKKKSKIDLDLSYDRLSLQGYLILFIQNEADIEYHTIISRYEQFTNGKFPFIYAIVQPSAVENDIDSFMSGLGYTSVPLRYMDDPM